MTLSVHDVVAFFLTQSPGHLSMSLIHRFAYFAQGWHLFWIGTPPFNEALRIRASGPVVHRTGGRNPCGRLRAIWA